MNNKILIGIILIIIIVVGAIFLLGRDGTGEAGAIEQGIPVVSSEVPASGSNVDETNVSINDVQLEGGEIAPDGEVQDLPETSDESAPSEEAVAESTPPQPLVITYTDTGFSPKVIEINSGDTVLFLNNSSKGMWVASNMHPTHTQYPEESEADCLGSSFDACISTPVGESWSFTFNSEGSWDYHDHKKASRTGTVVVN